MRNTYLLPTTFCPDLGGNWSLGTVPNESIIFFLHHLNPLGILKGSSDSARFSDKWNEGGETIFQVGFEDDIFRVGLHGMKVK